MAMRCKEVSMIGFEKKLCIVWFKWDWGRKDIQYDYICSIIDGTCVGLLAMLSFCTIPCCKKNISNTFFFRDLNRTHFWYSSEKKVGHIFVYQRVVQEQFFLFTSFWSAVSWTWQRSEMGPARSRNDGFRQGEQVHGCRLGGSGLSLDTLL